MTIENHEVDSAGRDTPGAPPAQAWPKPVRSQLARVPCSVVEGV